MWSVELHCWQGKGIERSLRHINACLMSLIGVIYLFIGDKNFTALTILSYLNNYLCNLSIRNNN